MMGFASDPPLFLPRPQTPGEVEHGPFDDRHTEIQGMPLDLMSEDVLTRSLLRDELKCFASNTLHEEFAKIRSLLKEDIQDVLLRIEARACCTIDSQSALGDKKAQNRNAPQKVQWAAPRPPSAKAEKENDDTLRRVASGGSQDIGTKSSVEQSPWRSSMFVFKAKSYSTTRFLLNGKIETDDRRASNVAKAGTRNTKSTVQVQKDMKRMKSEYRMRKAKRFQSRANLPDALGEKAKFQISRCLELFLEQGIALIIVLNGMFIGVQADYQARNVTEAVPAIFPLVEISFCVIFFVELVVRLCMVGTQFFVGQGWRWNWFDTILVLVQVIEVGGMLFTDHESSSATPVANVSFLRLLRILRLFRVLRLVRLVEFIGELNTIISSISNSMRSLCWTMFLLLLMIYIVGILFTQAVFSKRVLMEDSDPSSEELSKWWGTLDRSILSLYQAILGGVDWDDLTFPLSDHISPILTLLFCFYIAFTLLAMMNVITGIFVESALKNAEKERDNDFTETAHALFALSSEIEDSGQITWEEFVTQVDDPQFQFYMKSVGIDPADAKLLFKLLDPDKSGALDLQELLSGMIRLRAGAKFMDVMKIMHEIERSARRLDVGLDSYEKANAVEKIYS